MGFVLKGSRTTKFQYRPEFKWLHGRWFVFSLFNYHTSSELIRTGPLLISLYRYVLGRKLVQIDWRMIGDVWISYQEYAPAHTSPFENFSRILSIIHALFSTRSYPVQFIGVSLVYIIVDRSSLKDNEQKLKRNQYFYISRESLEPLC